MEINVRNASDHHKLLTDGSIVFLGQESELYNLRLVFEDNRLTLTQFFSAGADVYQAFHMKINGKPVTMGEQRTGSFGRRKIVLRSEINEDSIVEIVEQSSEKVIGFYRAIYEAPSEDNNFSKLTRLRRVLG